MIELLITLALLSLLTLTLFSSIRYGTRIWEASRSSSAGTDDVRAAQEELATLIASAYPKLDVTDAMHAKIAFDGTPDSLHLLAPNSEPNGALGDLTIALDAGGALILKHALELAPAEAKPESPQVLLSGVRAIAFGYFGPDKTNPTPQWHDSWQGKTRLPLLVRLRVAMLDRRITWPDLIVSPEIAGDVSCTLDAVTKFCQGR